MTGLSSRLLGLESLRLDDPQVSLALTRPIPAWAWALAVIAACAGAWLVYRRLAGPRSARGALAALRAGLVLSLLLLAAGPRLVKQSEIVERDWVLVLADRSASLTIADAPQAGPGGQPGEVPGDRPQREAQLRTLLGATLPAWQALAEAREVVWLGFDAGAYELSSGAGIGPGAGEASGSAAGMELPVRLGEPVGRRTALGAALEQGLRRVGARPLSGVVVFSDGRSSDEIPRSALRRLEAEQVPVMVVPLGSAEPVADLAVRRAEAPPGAFVGDFVPVEVEIERLGGSSAGGRGTVRLIDQATGEVLDERAIDLQAQAEGSPEAQRVTLTTRATDPGKAEWRVEIDPAGDDLLPANNRAVVSVDLVDEPLRAIYFDGYPRWEHRFLKNLLLRERSIRSSALLLAGGRRYLQEGDIVLTSVPASPEEWADIDVVILGDLRPEAFTRDQMEQIRELVAVRGAGLVWIAGESATPGAWGPTVLGDLLPVRVDASAMGPGVPTWDEEVTVAPTPLADRLGVLRLTDAPIDGSWWPAELSDAATGWSRLRWALRLDPAQLKPAAEVLALAVPVDPAAGPASPLVVTMRYGAGRVLLVGSDETWRWRYGRGELIPERFWLQLIRLLGRESLMRTARPATLELSPRLALAGEPMGILLRVSDQELAESAPLTVQVRLQPVDEQGAPIPGAASSEVLLRRSISSEPGGGVEFRATWVPSEPGRYSVSVVDAALADAAAPVDARVLLPDDELRQPETDHARLVSLAEATGGRVLDAEDLRLLPTLLPNREVRLLGPPQFETLWDTPLALLVVVGLAVLEWIGRRLIRLA